MGATARATGNSPPVATGFPISVRLSRASQSIRKSETVLEPALMAKRYYTGNPAQASATHKRAAFPLTYPPALIIIISTTMGDINKALEDLRSQESLNYSEIARKWNISRETLRRRHLGKQQPRQTAQAEANGILSPQQNKDLVAYICKLSARGTPPTPAMVKNFAFEISKRWPGKN